MLVSHILHLWKIQEQCTVDIVCVFSCLWACKKIFPKPTSALSLVYLFSLMIVFLILAWLHSSAAVDCTVLSLQMTSIWTVSIWLGFIYVGFRKAIFKRVRHFLTSFVLLAHQTLLWSFSALRQTGLELELSLTSEYMSPEKYAFWGDLGEFTCSQ